MPKGRKHYSGREKVAILREHLIDQVSVSDLCDKYGFQPTVFYRWQKEFFEKGELVFEAGRGPKSTAVDRENAALKEKLAKKDKVIAEIMEDYVAVKKSLGEN